MNSGTEPERTRARGTDSTPRRKRVVLANQRRTRPVARTMMELEEQTSVGEVLVRHLMKVQLRSSLILGGVTMGVFFGIPALFFVVPELGDTTMFGIRLPWLLLGAAPYPFLLLMGYLSTRSAERNEQDFIHMVER